jgi:phosphate transport system permease protein
MASAAKAQAKLWPNLPAAKKARQRREYAHRSRVLLACGQHLGADHAGDRLHPRARVDAASSAHVPLWDFLTDTQWTPLFDDAHFGIGVLMSGTLTSSVVALCVAIPLGTVIAIYLSEFAGHKTRETLKPLLELLSGVPTIIYGFFALLVVTPLLQKIFPELPGFNVLSAGLVMGVMIIPYVASLSEDAMRAVPMSLREGAYAMGSTRFQTAVNVVVPAAFSGIASAYILGISRAVGETMILAVAAGMQPNFDLQPHGARRHHDQLHRAGGPGRSAARLDWVPDHLRRRPGTDAADPVSSTSPATTFARSTAKLIEGH